MRTGKSSAVADMAAQLGEEVRAVTHTPANPEEFDLLRDLEAELELFEGDTIKPPKRGRGRPPGSPNRTTLQMARLLRAKGYRDPAEFLASIISMDLRELLEALRDGEDTSAADVLKIQLQAAKELMPYFHQKQPLAIEHKGEAHRPLFIINDGEGIGAMLADALGRMSAHDVEDYQRLSDGEAQASNGGASNDDA